MSNTANPHDAFIKSILSDPAVAADFLANYLPTGVAALLDFGSLRIEPGSFVSEDFAQTHSDMLFNLTTLSGQPLAVYVLFEHKSSSDRDTVLQILGYMTAIWQRLHRQKKPLVPIVPLVLYHGKRKWKAPVTLHDLIRPPADLKHYTPQFGFELLDLAAHDDDQLRGQLWLRIELLALKHATRGDVGPWLKRLGRQGSEITGTDPERQKLARLVRYLVVAAGDIDETEVDQFLDSVQVEGDEIMPTIAQKWEAQALAKGREEGELRGKLAMLLELRFGTDGLALLKKTDLIGDIETLKRLLQSARQADSIAEIEALVS